MLRKATNEGISNEESEPVIKHFFDNYHTFVEEYVMPEVIAYYLANSFYRNALWKATFLQHFISASNMFNLVNRLFLKFTQKKEMIKPN